MTLRNVFTFSFLYTILPFKKLINQNAGIFSVPSPYDHSRVKVWSWYDLGIFMVWLRYSPNTVMVQAWYDNSSHSTIVVGSLCGQVSSQYNHGDQGTL